MALSAGGTLPAHSAAGPVSIHVLQGAVAFEVTGTQYSLETGDVLVLEAGVAHSAASAHGALFLLTIVHQPSAGSPAADDAES